MQCNVLYSRSFPSWRGQYSRPIVGWLIITLFQKSEPPHVNWCCILGANKGKNNKNIFSQNLMVPPDPHIFTITRNGVNFQSAAELLNVIETSRTVYMVLVSPKETQLRTENSTFQKRIFRNVPSQEKIRGPVGPSIWINLSVLNPRKHHKKLTLWSIAYLKQLNLESYNTNVLGEVKINEARRNSFFDHHMSHFGAIFSEVTHSKCISVAHDEVSSSTTGSTFQTCFLLGVCHMTVSQSVDWNSKL